VKTTHGELYWQVEIRADKPGLDASVTRRLEVV
jgi:hypothetical protein